MTATIPIFDGHNDTLLRLVTAGGDPAAGFSSDGRGHLDLQRAKAGGFAGGLFACFVPPTGERHAGFAQTPGGYTVAMPEPPTLRHAKTLTAGMIGCAHQLAVALPGAVRICRTAADIRHSMAEGCVAMVLHLEGADAIGEDLAELALYYDQGVRSIGPVWSRVNRFGTGAPFQYPGDPGIGAGLTPAGFDLVRACNRLGIMLDVSHLNAAGFWDLVRTSTAPIVATHSNAHAICPVPRNLTDDQLAAIRSSGGLVGISLSVSELRPDGHNDPATPMAVVLSHLRYLLDRLDPTGVAIGSDFDGATLPADIADAGGLQNLVGAMASAGYDEPSILRLCHQNWIDVLERSWSAR